MEGSHPKSGVEQAQFSSPHAERKKIGENNQDSVETSSLLRLKPAIGLTATSIWPVLLSLTSVFFSACGAA
jgi:hypothetical protein